MVLCLQENTFPFKIFDNAFPAFEAIHFSVRARILIHAAFFIDHLDLFKAILQSDLKIIEVVSGGNLESPGSELNIDIRIPNDGNMPSQNREDHLLSDDRPVAFILWIVCYRGVTQYGLRPCRR